MILGKKRREDNRVMDPTDTPLSVRTAPNGRIIGTLPNEFLSRLLIVRLIETASHGFTFLDTLMLNRWDGFSENSYRASEGVR